jgi:Uma2 family endonuclease
MAIAHLASENYALLENITWDTYERLLREAGERHIRMTYDNGELEIMTLSFGHENVGEVIARLITTLTLVLDIAIRSGGSTTLRKKLKRKGLEPDKCFWIKNEKAMRDKTKWDAKKDPPPDLAVEVDIAHSSLNRMGIYAALGIPELWRYKGKKLRVYQRVEDGTYQEVPFSPNFPYLSMAKVNEFLQTATTLDETTLLRNFSTWVRTEVQPLVEGRPARDGKNRARQ